MAERLITVRDVASILGVTEKEVLNLVESAKIPAYKIGGVYLRFKPDQIEEFRKKSGALLQQKDTVPEKTTFAQSVRDFLYFNDFYLLAIIIIISMFFIIFRG